MRLRTYTLHLPELAMRGDAHALDAARIVPDGFSWPAFAFTVLWFVYHRLWLAALVVLLGLVGLSVAGRYLGLPPIAITAVTLLASVLIGLEASSLRRWTYGRRGRPARDAVLATSIDEAEAKATARWLASGDTAVAAPAYASGTPRRMDSAVIGLFPLSEGKR